MIDKQIIIDGIKTSKEDFTDNFSIELTNCNIEERKQIGGKYFDIILRKEQEHKETQKALAKCWIENGRLKKECEELTSKCSQLEEEFTKTAYALLKIQYELADNCNYYHQALSEIKELLLKTPTDSQEHCVNAKSVILQKISEVDNDN